MLILSFQLKLLICVCLFKMGKKLSPEYFRDYFYRNKKLAAGAFPTLCCSIPSSCRYEGMQMRMVHQVLSPGVQEGHHSCFCSKMLTVTGKHEQGLRSCFKQQVIYTFLVEKSQRIKLRGYGENDVEVADRQEF